MNTPFTTQRIALSRHGEHMCLISPRPNIKGVVHYRRNEKGEFVRKGLFGTHQKVWLVSLCEYRSKVWALTGTSVQGKSQVLLWRYDEDESNGKWTQVQDVTALPELDTQAVFSLSILNNGKDAVLLSGQGKVWLEGFGEPNLQLKVKSKGRRFGGEFAVSLGTNANTFYIEQFLLARDQINGKLGLFNYVGNREGAIRHPASGFSLRHEMLPVVPAGTISNNSFFCVPNTGGVLEARIIQRNNPRGPEPALVIEADARANFAEDDFGTEINGIAQCLYSNKLQVALVSGGEWALYEKERSSPDWKRKY